MDPHIFLQIPFKLILSAEYECSRFFMRRRRITTNNQCKGSGNKKKLFLGCTSGLRIP